MLKLKVLFVYFLLLFVVTTHYVVAQDNLKEDDDTETNITIPDENSTQKSKPIKTKVKSENGFQVQNLFFGMGGAASFQNNYSYWSVTPLIGYQFSKRWAAGLQMSYSRAKEFLTIDQTFTSVGVMPFARAFLAENFFLQGEYQFSSWTLKDNLSANTIRYTFSVPFIGVGYMIPMGERLKIVGLIRYALADPANARNPYRNSPLQYSVFFQF